MPQTITITVGEKIASTDFKEVVSFNSDYLLHFDLDGDWEEFTHRVAVVIWADGCTETRFDGTDCAFPTVSSAVADSVLVGVYAANETRKIASTFVRLRCRAGAHAVPAEKPAASLHEQILSFLNEKDWSIFRDKVKEGMYSAVRVSKQGIVIEGRQVIEVGAIGQTKPGDSLIFGGIFIRRSADGKAEIFHYTQSGGTALTLAECAHSESADTAETATNANHAETADTATNATNADHAVSADTATKAEQDSNGASIPETYATKSELQSKISEENAAWKAESSELGIRIDDIEKGETLVGHANHADTATGATNAGHAVSADTAENATNATHAVSAGTAVNADEAAHATNADEATHAESADTATNATNANHAVSADTATKAEQDSNGAAIPETYATKSELQSKISEENAAWKAESSELGIRIDDIEKGETLVGHANHADTATGATNAGHAVSADTAENASNATHAVSADTAVNANEAAHATNADEATHAESADYAQEAMHAETADTATNTTNADHAVSADTATKAEQDSNGAAIPETYATKSELQSKISEENAAWKAESSELGIRIDDIEKGETLVGHADRANTATSATNATHAVSTDTAVNADEAVHAQTADSADKVTHRLNVFRDGVLLAEYDGSEQIVIDLPSNDGGIAEKVSHKLTAKVNATMVTYDGSAEVTIPTVFAPNSGGTYGYFLKSNGSSVAPVWSKLPLTGTSGARAVNGSSVSVTHGLGESPAEIFLQLYSPNNKGTNYYVTSKSSTTFTVSFYSSGTAGAQSITGTLYWMALS